jgi:hypothetical protein
LTIGSLAVLPGDCQITDPGERDDEYDPGGRNDEQQAQQAYNVAFIDDFDPGALGLRAG